MAYIGNSYSQQITQAATDVFSGNGVTTTFTLTRPVQSAFTVEVVVDNVQQNPYTAFSINASNQIVFSGPPASGSNNIYVMYNGGVAQVGTLGNGVVGSQQLAPNAVTQAALDRANYDGTGAAILPYGASGLRPGGVEGMIRKNTTTGYFEYYDPSGNLWRNVGLAPQAYAFSGTITFTPCGATGRMGPTIQQARSTYTSQPFQSTWLNNLNLFYVEQGIQYWVVPKDGTYTISAMGAGLNKTGTGGGTSGLGAKVQASFQLYAGERLRIIVGQQGLPNSLAGTAGCYGGSGASAVSVYRNNCEQLLILGGGGAGIGNNSTSGTQSVRNGQYTNSGVPEGGFGSTWEYAYNPSSGIQNYWGGHGGGGWMRRGTIGGIGAATAKKDGAGDALSASAIGGYHESGAHGGFGGGGGTGRDSGAAGGGGGYNGGHAEAYENNDAATFGTGGGSYVGLGATQTNVLQNNAGDGAVTVTL